MQHDDRSWRPGPVLGIESSCDETACAVLDADGRILAQRVLSQQDHAAFGGVVPEIAARAHLAHLPTLARTTLAAAGMDFAALHAVAATSGPGLIGGLIVGAGYGKGVALARGIAFVAVNHLEAHALTARLPGLGEEAVAFPYLLLLVSGGHCQLAAVEGVGRYRLLGRTIDDAVGEAFDKVGKMLGLGWPGGPALERLAAGGDAGAVALPRPMLGRENCDFSFSGLKTAVLRHLVAHRPQDIAASFQRVVAEVLTDRTMQAMRAMPEATALVVAGGVAANAAVRTALAAAAAGRGLRMVAPPLPLCGDNAVMVAWAGIERLRLGWQDLLDHAPRPRWGLDAADMQGRPGGFALSAEAAAGVRERSPGP